MLTAKSKGGADGTGSSPHSVGENGSSLSKSNQTKSSTMSKGGKSASGCTAVPRAAPRAVPRTVARTVARAVSRCSARSHTGSIRGYNGKPKAFKVDMKDILTSPFSELTRTDLREVFSVEALIGCLEPSDRIVLFDMLPSVDRSPEGLLHLMTRSPDLRRSIDTYRDLLQTGQFDSDIQNRLRCKRRRRKGWTQFKEQEYENYWGLNLIKVRGAHGVA